MCVCVSEREKGRRGEQIAFKDFGPFRLIHLAYYGEREVLRNKIGGGVCSVI